MAPITPLDTFRQLMQLNPFHFWGLANATVPLPSDCDALTREYGWQDVDVAGREDIRQATEQAETMMREQLGFSIAPRFIIETIRFPRYHDTAQNQVGCFGSDGRWIAVQLGEGHLQTIGIETRTLIGTATTNPGGGMTFADTDGDGLYDTFTITMATTVTDPNQIAVYAGAPYRLDGEARSERWRIKPVTVSISGGVATIKGKWWTIVQPLLYQVVGLSSIDPDVTSNFMGTLDVCRYFADPTGTTTATAQTMLIWETEPWPVWSTACGSDTSGVTFDDDAADPAAQAYAIARASLRDIQRGVIGVGEAVYNSTTGAWEKVSMSFCRPPDRIEVRYQAGDALVGGQVNPRWARVVCQLAAALLGKNACECDNVSRELHNWQLDRAYAGSRDNEQFSLAPGDLGNPFGTRTGAIAAWHAVELLRETRGVLA